MHVPDLEGESQRAARYPCGVNATLRVSQSARLRLWCPVLLATFFCKEGRGRVSSETKPRCSFLSTI